MIAMQRDGRNAVLAALLFVISLAALPAHAAATPRAGGGCGPRPSWIEGATLAGEGHGQLSSCFTTDSSQAEARLSVSGNRPYAQLITIAGGQLDVSESSFSSPLETALARRFASAGSGSGPAAILLGPTARATLAISRPAPGAAQEVHIDPAPDNAFAVAALAFRLLSAAAKHRSLSAAAQSCIATAVYGALSSPPHPQRALRLIHACVNAAALSPPAEKLLRGLAGSLLRDTSFKQIIKREGAERHSFRIAFTISASNPNLVNPAIHLGLADLGTVPSGQLTVKRLSAGGGAPPYRFYIVPEPGGPSVPPWLRLAADGTLTIEPPIGATSVNLPVEVVDSNGEHSVVPY